MKWRFSACTLLLATAVSAQSRPATTPTSGEANGLAQAFDAFVSAAGRRDMAAAEVLVFRLESIEGPPDAVGLARLVDSGIFADATVSIVNERTNQDCSVVIASVTLGNGKTSTDPTFGIRHDGRWKILLHTPDAKEVLTTKLLTAPQKARLGALNVWSQTEMNRQRQARRANPTTREAERFARQADLEVAVRRGDVEKVRALVAAGADVNEAARDGQPPLCYAASQEKTEMLRLLLSVGATTDPRWSTKVPLFEAIDNGRPTNARLLIEAGARIDRLNSDGVTPLFWAVAKGLGDTVALLLEKGAKFDDARLPFPILHAAATAGDYTTFEAISKFYPELTVKGPGESTALHFLALSGSQKSEGLRKIVQALLAGGVDPHAVVRNDLRGAAQRGTTDRALQISLSLGHSTVAGIFLDEVKYPVPELTACVGRASDGLVKAYVLEKLIAKGASVSAAANAVRAGTMTPLHRAVQNYVSDPEKILLLLDAGHPIDPIGGDKKRTPLLEAVARSRADCVRVLLDRGADPTIKDADGHDAISLARLRIENGREIGTADRVKYWNDKGDAADEGTRLLDLLTKK